MKLEDIKIGDVFKEKINGVTFIITDIFKKLNGYYYLKYKVNGVKGQMSYSFFKGLQIEKIKKENKVL